MPPAPDPSLCDAERVSRPLRALLERLAPLKSVVVAFSGGVDSAVVLAAAFRALGHASVLAVTGRSPSVPQSELGSAAALAAQIGAAHEFLDTREFENPDYLANPTNRCYFCKTELYSNLGTWSRARGFANVVSGVNADDLHDFRPGLRAADEHRVRAPLSECGLTKSDVRALAAELGLPVADKPASPCLSSRVQYGESITPEKLLRIDAAETFLRELGFRECRVRHHDNLARIEVPPQALDRFADAELRRRVDARLRELGYAYVTLDLRGFRSGSLNETLVRPDFLKPRAGEPRPQGVPSDGEGRRR